MLLYKIINPVVKTLLRSPLHGLMSGNTLILYLEGRKSGRALATPVSYLREGKTVFCFTAKSSPWWRNAAAMSAVDVLIRRKRYAARPTIVIDSDERKAAVLTKFLRAVPRDAGFAGVKLDKAGEPDRDDVNRVVPGMVLVEFEL